MCSNFELFATSSLYDEPHDDKISAFTFTDCKSMTKTEKSFCSFLPKVVSIPLGGDSSNCILLARDQRVIFRLLTSFHSSYELAPSREHCLCDRSLRDAVMRICVVRSEQKSGRQFSFSFDRYKKRLAATRSCALRCGTSQMLRS